MMIIIDHCDQLVSSIIINNQVIACLPNDSLTTLGFVISIHAVKTLLENNVHVMLISFPTHRIRNFFDLSSSNQIPLPHFFQL